MNKLSLKRIHLEHLHIRKCLQDNIMGEDTLIFSGKTEGLNGSLARPLYCYMCIENKQEKEEIPVQMQDYDHRRCLLQAA